MEKEELKQKLLDSDINFNIGDYNGEEFMIVDDWDDIQKIQKVLNPEFQPKDKYDSTILDDFISWGFADEYTRCDECGKVIRTEPDSKHWTPDFWVDYENGYVVCGDCVRNNPQEYLIDLTNNSDKANTILDDGDLTANGYVKLDDEYESGWYGKNDNPQDILENLLNEHPSGQFIFSITNQQQFGTWFVVWALESSLEEGLKEDTGYDHYGAKDMTPFKGPAYIEYDGGPRQIDVLTKAKNHRWVWKNEGGCSDEEWYIFPTYEDALKVQKEVGGEIKSWNEYAGIDEGLDKEQYIYLFPSSGWTKQDTNALYGYNLIYLGKNKDIEMNGEETGFINIVVQGTKEDLEEFGDKWLDGYELHPDYLYKKDEFAGEIY